MQFPKIDPNLLYASEATHDQHSPQELGWREQRPRSVFSQSCSDSELISHIMLLEADCPLIFAQIRNEWGQPCLHEFLLAQLLTGASSPLSAAAVSALMAVQNYHADRYGFSEHGLQSWSRDL